MSFSSQKAVYYFINQFQYSLLIKCIKMAILFMHQQFQNSKSCEIEPKVLKRQCIGIHNNEKEQGLDKYKNEEEGEDIGYILPLGFIALFSP